MAVQGTLIEEPAVEYASVETAPQVAPEGNVFRDYQPGQEGRLRSTEYA